MLAIKPTKKATPKDALMPPFDVGTAMPVTLAALLMGGSVSTIGIPRRGPTQV